MKYLVLTLPADAYTDVMNVSAIRDELESGMPGVKVVVVYGATSAVLVDVEPPEQQPTGPAASTPQP